MDSTYKKSNNLIYNILNYEEPNIIFNYGIILVIIIFIFIRIDFSFTLFIGLIFFSIIIMYINTNRSINVINEIQKKEEKFNLLFTENKILQSEPKIVDLFFYMLTIKEYNLNEFNKIITKTEIFITNYNSCLNDYSLIDSVYDNLLDLKVQILFDMNAFIFNEDNNYIEDKIINVKIKLEKTLNEYLDKIDEIQKKKLYYNGYNIKTKNLRTSNVLPYNFLNSFTINNTNNMSRMENLLIY